ncbi:MAG: DUF6773 family protein [Syntrophomonas sp.]
MKLFKKVVDERQELELLKIEHYGFWILFWGLCISTIVQVIVMDAPFKQVAAEFSILMVGSIGILVGCVMKGQWDYYTMPNTKTYILTGGIGATIFCLIFAIAKYAKSEYYHNNVNELFVTTMVNFALLFASIFITTAIVGKLVEKKREKLAREYGDKDGI